MTLQGQSWKDGFPIYLYDPDSLEQRRLSPPAPLAPAVQTSEKFLEAANQANASDLQAQLATPEPMPIRGTDPIQNIPLPSIADEEAPCIMDPKTFLECCRRTWSLNQEYGFPIGKGVVGVDHFQGSGVCRHDS